jgi:peptide/nickel transport system substrate-binding protein
MLDVPVPEWEALRALPGIGTHAQPGLRVYYLMFNLVGPPGRPLSDIRVRQAIARALDRESLLSGPLAGAGVSIRSLMPPAVFGHHPGSLAPERDLGGALRLLRQAGRATGLSLSLALGRQADSPALGRALQSSLAAVGIALELVEEFPTLSTPEAAAAGPDMYLLGWLHSSGDAGASYEYLAHSPGPGAAGSVSGYSDPELDGRIAEASGPLPMRERRDRLIAIAEVLQSRVVMIPLYRQVDRYAWVQPLQLSPRLDRRIRVDELHWGTPPPASALWP